MSINSFRLAMKSTIDADPFPPDDAPFVLMMMSVMLMLKLKMMFKLIIMLMLIIHTTQSQSTARC